MDTIATLAAVTDAPAWRCARVEELDALAAHLPALPLELDPRWLATRLDSPGKSLAVFVLDSSGAPRGYAPFFVHPTALSYCLGEQTLLTVPVRRFALAGAPLADDEAALAALFPALHAAVGPRAVAFFEGVPRDSALAALLERPSLMQGLFHVIPYGPCYPRRLITLPEGAGYEDYLKTLGAKTRQDLRRTRKRFLTTAGGEIETRRYRAPEEVEAFLDAVARVSRKTYQWHLLGLGLEATPALAARLEAAARTGWLRAYVSFVDGEPVAFQLGYRDGDTYYAHDIGYDPALAKLQPGIFLHTEILPDLLADGIRRFDFLVGDSLHKQRLSNHAREERHYYLIPRGWPGTPRAWGLTAINALSATLGSALERSGLKARLKRLLRRRAVEHATTPDEA